MDKQMTMDYLKDIVTLESRKRTAGNMYNRMLVDEKNCKAGLGATAVKPKLQIGWKKLLIRYWVWGTVLGLMIMPLEVVSENAVMGDAVLSIFIILFYVFYIGYVVWKVMEAKQAQENTYEDNKQYAISTVQRSTTQLALIQQEKPKLKAVYVQCDETLQKLYTLGIVHPKYRDFVPCAMFLEYLGTGRTHSLEASPGDKGAYNLYEEELKFQIISNKLDRILQNQKVICQEIRNINATVESLYSSMKQIETNTKQIEHNTKISAWCNSVTMYNTSVMRKRIDDYYKFG